MILIPVLLISYSLVFFTKGAYPTTTLIMTFFTIRYYSLASNIPPEGNVECSHPFSNDTPTWFSWGATLLDRIASCLGYLSS